MGVAIHLRRINSGIVSIHCVAHRQASQLIKYLARFKQSLFFPTKTHQLGSRSRLF